MKIIVADRNLIPHRSRLEAAVPPDARLSWHDGFDEAALAEDLRDADVYVGGRFTPSMASSAERLRLVHVAGAGTDNIAFDALAPDTLVANTFHHEQSIAEYVAAAAVMLRRGVLAQDEALRGGVWATSVYDDRLTQSNSLQAARVGFVGFGHIGATTWKLFRAFGATGSAVTGRGNVDAAIAGLEWAADASQLDRLMRDSDVVVVSAPLDDRTRGMIGAEELRALGSDGVLINVGRGPLVQEQALFDALSSSTIAAAAIDVWYDYPDTDGRGTPSALPFSELPNILMTPHSSGVSRQTFLGRVDDIAGNITRLSRGEQLRNVVAPAVGSKGTRA
ncbi:MULTISPECIES: 2-hydroxyacid dehydrogenase [unclassified Rhodococcus (in: high G+C Gram-positive bacteria)]|uniref:2-hydroxyacid dehydrogenase n=1 Tax=unclassified Rhodococcus (in: high G+C Gram-positive bacteria) TaxID=192944 RepID=UPI00163A0BA1|nr:MULTISPECIES: 2-hydroxyacid dehydrogenase [unclassified Rhodococcus (in: high G+C Gram-positive bacteria)]MBC2642175.1 hydroxyacid dehydrogenase [Rhodococcus sp. 3A]MBC2893083.1 hydroxyacid dehydrogenase [Rhodococcus sp. 4CII]